MYSTTIMQSFYIALLAIVFSFTVQADTGYLKKVHTALEQVSQKEIPIGELQSCGPLCISFLEQTSGMQFVVQIDNSLNQPEITLDSNSKTLSLPSVRDLGSPDRNTFQKFLMGHIWHPYLDSFNLKPSQKTAIQAFTKILEEGSKSFLHVAPTGMGKTVVLAQALLHQVQSSTKQIFIVTAHQIQLVHQLFSAIEAEKERQGLKKIRVVNWSQGRPRRWQDLAVMINQSASQRETLILVITSQSLKAQVQNFQTQNNRYGVYTTLTQNLGGVYVDEAHHLGAKKTQQTIIDSLVKDSGAFLYGATATPGHYEVELRDLFQTQHWSYLNTEENLLEEHFLEKVLQQLRFGIDRGEITFFDDTYVIGESSFREALMDAEGTEGTARETHGIEGTEEAARAIHRTEEAGEVVSKVEETHRTEEAEGTDNKTNQSLFISSSESRYRELNPAAYDRLAEILFPIFEDNSKGFIVTASIHEAERVSEFLNKKFKDIEFSPYHSGQSPDERRQILKKSKESKGSHYIVAVRALDEGVDLPHLSAYIDLNSEISIKQRVHRIGRVLRLHPGKVQSDILFLISYENQKMMEDTLKLLDVVERVSFKGGMKRGERRQRQNLGFKKPEHLNREGLISLREELRESAKKFWNTRPDGSFLTLEEWFEAVIQYNEQAKKEGSPLINSSTISKLKLYKKVPGSPRNPKDYYGKEKFDQAGGWGRVTGFTRPDNRKVINGELRYFTMEECFEAVIQYNEQAKKEGRPLITSGTIRQLYTQIHGLHYDPREYYGKEKFDQAGGWERVTGIKKRTDNRKLINGEWRLLTMEEWFEAIILHNKQLRQEGRPLINSGDIRTRCTQIPGSPSHPRRDYGEEKFDQAGGWERVTGIKKRTDNRIFINGELRLFNMKEWFKAIIPYNEQLRQEGRPLINSKNIGTRRAEILGSPTNPRRYYGKKKFDRAGGWERVTGRKQHRDNRKLINGEWRLFTMEEWFEAVIPHNEQLRREGRPPINSTTIRTRRTEILGSPYDPRHYYGEEKFDQAGGWERVTGRDNRILINGEWRLLTMKEWFEAIIPYNEQLRREGRPPINSKNIGTRRTEILGSPYDPRTYYGEEKFDQAGGWERVRNACSAQLQSLSQ